MKINHTKLDMHRYKLNEARNKLESKITLSGKNIDMGKKVEFNGETKSFFRVIVENAKDNFDEIESYELNEQDKICIANILATLTHMAATQFTSIYEIADKVSIEEYINYTNEFIRDIIFEILEDCTYACSLKNAVKSTLISN